MSLWVVVPLAVVGGILVWTGVAFLLGVVIGRAIRLADRRQAGEEWRQGHRRPVSSPP